MITVSFNEPAGDKAQALREAFGIAEKSNNIMGWTARAKMGKAVPQEMQLLSTFLSQHGLEMAEYLREVSISEC